jgi:hypothetical protein
LTKRGHIVAAALRHPDVGEHDVGTLNGNTGDGLFPIPDSDHLHILSRERQLDDALNGYAVIGKQELVRHGPP